jgi:hypothetical protein
MRNLSFEHQIIREQKEDAELIEPDIVDFSNELLSVLN